MDFAKIKNLIKQNGDKFIFVENGEPDLVMMSFAEYERLLSREDEVGYSDLFQAGAPELEPDIRRDVTTPIYGEVPELRRPSAEPVPYRKFAGFGRSETVGLPVHLEDIRLEDLPV
ncbi:MAG: hypothetical protein HY007_03785 [Candidatus Sungbacteria bacterium]|nr:hypothetical protein [Candidatus Sungbacteria bacterium]